MPPSLRPLLLAFCLGAAPPAAASEGAVVLLYHRFDEPRHASTQVSTADFERHLELIEQGDHTVWPLERVLAHWQTGTLPRGVVALTVDDAFRSVYRVAWPRLRDRGWPLTVFVNTEDSDLRRPDFLTWDQMRAMRAEGVVFANHASAHDRLWVRRPGESEPAWAARTRASIEGAQRRLEAELGPAPRWLAYPYGEFDAATAELARQMGYIAFGQHSGVLGPGLSPQALPRFAVTGPQAQPAAVKTRLQARAFRIRSMRPGDPRTRDPRPRLVVELEDGPLAGLGCYTGNGTATEVRWETATRFSAQTRAPLASGRDRYNCTAPAPGGGHYWLGQPWITATTGSPAGR